MLLSIVPVAAFGAINTYSSVVEPPTGSVSATTKVTDRDEDGAEFTATLVGAFDVLYVASSRSSVDYFFYKHPVTDTWEAIPKGVTIGATTYDTLYDVKEFMSKELSPTSRELKLKVISSAAGTSQIVYGIVAVDVFDYARGKTPDNGLANIIGQRRWPAEFTAPKALGLDLSVNGIDRADAILNEDVGVYVYPAKKPANNVDSYTLTAYISTEASMGGSPVSGREVTFSITSGTGGTLSATRVTTNVSGRAEVKVYANRPDTIEVLARVANLNEQNSSTTWQGFIGGIRKFRTDKVRIQFKSTGVVSIKAESDNNQKVARGNDSDTKRFWFSAYDASGLRLDSIKYGGHEVSWPNNTTIPGAIKDQPVGQDDACVVMPIWAQIVKSPSGSNIDKKYIEFMANNNGNFGFGIKHQYLNKDGEYEIKVYLTNGVNVSYTFTVRDQGDIVLMKLAYGASSYAAGSWLLSPDVKYQDADGYEKSKSIASWANSQLALSISDASFLDSKLESTTGEFKLKSDKNGSITMTAVDKDKNLIATQVLTIEKSASYLKLTPAAVGAVGGEVNVAIELVDVDGKLAATYLAAASSSAVIVSRPADATASAGSVIVNDFNKGKANVRVSCNVEGDVILQVVITEVERAVPPKFLSSGSFDRYTTWQADVNNQTKYNEYWNGLSSDEKYGGRTYTGACTVSFGAAGVGGGTIIFIIGSPSYVVGAQPFAAQSPAFIQNGRTFLGVRDIGNAIGGTIDWDDDTQTATVAKGNIVVKVTVGAEVIVITKNGVTSEKAIDAAAMNKDGRVYLPFRALLEAFGYKVDWDEATQSIICTI